MQLILTGAVIVFNSILGLAVFLANKKKAVNIVFSLFVLSVVGWTISNYFADNVRDFAAALFWVRSSFAFTSLIGAFLLLFSYFYTEQKERTPPSTVAAITISAIFMFLLCFTPAITKTVELKNWGANTINGDYFYIFTIYFAGTILTAVRKLVVQYRKAKGQQRQQIQYLFFGLAISIIFATTTNLVIPLITGSTSLAKYGPFGTVFLIGFTSFAIIKHRLMDIRLLVLKSVAYSLSLAIVAAGYISITYFILRELRLDLNPTVFNIAVLFTLVFTFNPLRLFIQKYTDKLFFRGRYNFHLLLAELIDITKMNSRSINALMTKLTRTLTTEVRISQAIFILAGKPRVSETISIGYKNVRKSAWTKLLKMSTEAEGTIFFDELSDDSAEKKFLRHLGVVILLPIKTKSDTIAALALGEKKSGNTYTDQDINLLELICPQTALALENAKSFIERGQRIAELKSINKMFRHIEHFLDLDKLLETIVDESISITGADGGSLMLVDKGGQTLSVKTARNLHPSIKLGAKTQMGEGIAGTVAKTRRPLIVNGLADPVFKPHLKREDIHSALSVPMMVENKIVGVLNVNRKKDISEFTEASLSIMTAFASQAAEAIVKTGYYDQIEKLSLKNDTQFREFIKALARTVDAKDPYTFGHSEMVTFYSLQVAEEMGLDDQQKRSLEIGGQLHDMGKIGIPESILNKPGPLTKEEYKSIRRHPQIGADILRDTESLKEIRDLILYHHEHFDGSGYPAGLKGTDIPLESRILAVVDSFDSMMSRRAYRQPLPREEAIKELRRCSGSQFDPEVVKTLLMVLNKEQLNLSKYSIKSQPDLSMTKIVRVWRRVA